MKKSDLKELIKPIVKECMQEALLESGLVSKTVSEVLKGVMPILLESKKQQVMEPTRAPAQVVQENADSNGKFSMQSSISKLRNQQKRNLNEIGSGAYSNLNFNVGGVNVFEGTKPVPAESAARGPGDPLADTDPNDPGVDLSAFGFGK